jgi:2,3-bisphosphoglycerate-independent phosphoglycerate mutase
VHGQRQVLFLFLDGVGLGRSDPQGNPFARVAMPHLEALLGGQRLVADGLPAHDPPLLVNTERASLLAVDACMGVEGVPQSATGQAALLTGKNVPAWLGEHEGPKPNAAIMALIQQGTLFTQLHQLARSADLLNAYPPRYFESIERGYHLPGVVAYSAWQAGIPLKTQDDLLQGDAISADFSGEGWHTLLGFINTPLISYEQAGERFAALAKKNALTVFEYWLTDVAGHHQDGQAAQSLLKALDEVIGTVDRFIVNDQRLLVITSDHGNLEDLRTRHHTRNDVPLILIGSQAARREFLAGLDQEHNCRRKPDLTDIGPAMVKFIG